jgi:hypothetical protein
MRSKKIAACRDRPRTPPPLRLEGKRTLEGSDPRRNGTQQGNRVYWNINGTYES